MGNATTTAIYVYIVVFVCLCVTEHQYVLNFGKLCALLLCRFEWMKHKNKFVDHVRISRRARSKRVSTVSNLCKLD